MLAFYSDMEFKYLWMLEISVEPVTQVKSLR